MSRILRWLKYLYILLALTPFVGAFSQLLTPDPSLTAVLGAVGLGLAFLAPVVGWEVWKGYRGSGEPAASPQKS